MGVLSIGDNMSEKVYSLVDLFCYLLDCVPAREDGVWYRHGGWGCRMGILGKWDNLAKDYGWYPFD